MTNAPIMMKLPFVALLLVFIVGAAGLFVYWLFKRRFSLRWLMMVVAMIAVVLGAVSWWQTAGRAGLRRVDLASPEAAAMRPDAVIVEREGDTTGDSDDSGRREFVARFVPRYRNINQLASLPEVDEARAEARDETSGSFGVTYFSNMQQVDFEASSRAELEAVLETIRAADVLRPEHDESVIFGIVVDAEGEPVAGATVNLEGPFVYINHFRTRDDGTFLMPIQAPAGRGYYLSIRVGKEKKILTRSFRYDGPGTELGLRVTVD